MPKKSIILLPETEEILEQIKGYVPKYNYQEDGYVYLFNQKYQIILKDMNIKKCAIHDRQIYVYSKNIQATIEIFLKQELMNYLKERMMPGIGGKKMPDLDSEENEKKMGCLFLSKK